MSPEETFESQRPHAMRVAYRLLGTLAEAEDVVQEAWLRWSRVQASEIRSPKAWLTTTVTRLAIDQLRAQKARRETYPGPWLPTPLIEFDLDHLPDEKTPSPEDRIALADDVSLALMMVLEQLGPEERAAFILREAFDTDYGEIARILGKSEAACRQIVSRAHKHIRAGKPRFEQTKDQHSFLHSAFLQALQSGDVEAFGKLCAKDAVLLSDGGGKVQAALNPLYGRDRVTRFILGLSRKWVRWVESGRLPGQTLEFYSARINGLPGFVTFTGEEIYMSVALDTDDEGRISHVYMMRNPDKLKHVHRPSGPPTLSFDLRAGTTPGGTP